MARFSVTGWEPQALPGLGGGVDGDGDADVVCDGDGDADVVGDGHGEADGDGGSDGDETAGGGSGDAWVGAIVMKKTYASGLVGESVAEFLSSGTQESGQGYLAVERITGTLDDGRHGSFTVHHGALQHPDSPTAFGYIVPGTGTGDFATFSGMARIVHDDDGPYFVFTLDS